MALTDSAVARLKITGKQYEKADDAARGLVVRVTAKGAKTWVYRYRTPQGKMKRIALGAVDDMGVQDARAELARWREIRKTDDPQHHRAEQERLQRLRADQEQVRIRTFQAVAEDMIERFGDGKHGKGWLRAEGQRCLQMNVYPYLGDWPVDEIKKQDVIAALEALRQRGKIRGKGKMGRQLNIALMLIRRVLQHAVDELDLVDYNVAWRIKKRVTEKSKDRALSGAEIKTLFDRLPSTGLAPVTILSLKFQLLTGTRISEVAELPWSEIDRDLALWKLPAARSKNGKPGDIPISPQAFAVLDEVRAFYGKSKWCFPSPQGGSGHLTVSVAQKALNRLFQHRDRPLGDLEKLTPHDLRRTASTAMGNMGITQDVIDACLRNGRGGVSAVYNRSQMLPHTRTAMGHLGRWVDAALQGGVYEIPQGES